MRVRLEFKPQDCWVGVFWKHTTLLENVFEPWPRWDVWICLVPMLPLHISWRAKFTYPFLEKEEDR